MELQNCIETRRSVRAFNDKPISDEALSQLVDAAKYAPSWKNTQVTRYYAVKSPDVKAKVVSALNERNHPAALSAPILIVCTVVKNHSGYTRDGKFDSAKGKGWQMYDCGLSNMLFTLKANELGLGSVIMGLYDEEKLSEAINVPDTEEVTSVIALGYYDEKPAMPPRKEIAVLLKLL